MPRVRNILKTDDESSRLHHGHDLQQIWAKTQIWNLLDKQLKLIPNTGNGDASKLNMQVVKEKKLMRDTTVCGLHNTYTEHDTNLKVHGEGKLGNQDNDPEKWIPVVVPKKVRKDSRHKTSYYSTAYFLLSYMYATSRGYLHLNSTY